MRNNILHVEKVIKNKIINATTSPLREILKKQEFQWTDQCNITFQSLKDALAGAAQLPFPDPNLAQSITADASGVAIGRCLNQTQGGISKRLSLFSRRLSDTERHYSTFDRKLLAICADHKPIVGAFNSNNHRSSDR